MGACGCNKSNSDEEELFNVFWNSLQIKTLTPEQLLEKTMELKNFTKEEFFSDFEEKIIEAYFNSPDIKTVSEYLIKNSLSMVSPFKALAVFFSLLLLCDYKSEKSFSEAFKRFWQICNKLTDLSSLNFNDQYLIKEFVTFHVYLVSAQTHKAFLVSPNAQIFEKSRTEFNSIFSQKNRDIFVESLFSYFQRNEFNLLSFAYENLKKLQHEQVRMTLEDIERKKVVSMIEK